MMKVFKFRQGDISQLIRWGHWFVFCNIILILLIGSAYPILSDWPSTLLGRVYAITSTLGQFAFLAFLLYLITAFPLTFLFRNYQRLRLFMVLVATIGLTVLCSDLILYAQFKLHLNRYIVGLLFAAEQEEPIFNGYFILLVFISFLLLEYAIATLTWRKLKSLHKRKRILATPLVVICIGSFLFSHLVHIWADANFYRPITMQRKNLPLSYPLTARHLLGKYGLLDEQNYQQRLVEQGNPFSSVVEYPLQKIQYRETQANDYHLLFITLNGIKTSTIAEDMPFLTQFAHQNLNFTQHYSAGLVPEMGAFSLFYGIAPNLYDAVVVGRKQSVLMSALAKRHYQVGFFSMTPFDTPLYRQALLADYTVPAPHFEDRQGLLSEWVGWLNRRQVGQPWFSYLTFDFESSEVAYQTQARQLDHLLQSIMTQLDMRQLLDKTVVVITANYANQSDKQATYRPEYLHVPLIIHWPDKTAKVIQRATGHMDITRTVSEDILAVDTSPYYYSQGLHLFDDKRKERWLYAGDHHNLIVFTEDNIIRLDQRGRYTIYNQNYEKQDEATLPTATLLKLVKESRRFIVH